MLGRLCITNLGYNTIRLYELPKSVVAAFKDYSHKQNVDRGTTGEATKAGGSDNYSKDSTVAVRQKV